MLEILAMIGATALILLFVGIYQEIFENDVTEKRVDDKFKGDDYDEKSGR